jgi:hypothetical protein
MDQPHDTPTGPDRKGKHTARVPRGLLVAMMLAALLLAAGVGMSGYLWGTSRDRAGAAAEPTPPTAGGVSAGGPTAQPTTTTAPPPRRLGILITKNIGTGEQPGQANRVYLVGRDTDPDPDKLRVDYADRQPVDIDPRENVRRIIHVPTRQILQRHSASAHLSPQFVARPGERVQIVVQNRDSMVHSFTFDPAEKGLDVYAGKTRTLTFTAPRAKPPPGKPWTFYCRWRQVGMDGVLVVRGPPVPK